MPTMHHDASVAGEDCGLALQWHHEWIGQPWSSCNYDHCQEQNKLLTCSMTALTLGFVAASIIWLVNFHEWKASEEQRWRLLLLVLAHELIMPQVRCQLLMPTLQARIRMSRKMISLVDPTGSTSSVCWQEDTILLLSVKLARKLSWNVADVGNLYIPTAQLRFGDIYWQTKQQIMHLLIFWYFCVIFTCM